LGLCGRSHLERRARAQVRKPGLPEPIPVGRPEALPRVIFEGAKKARPRVIYPRFFAPAAEMVSVARGSPSVSAPPTTLVMTEP